MNLQKPHDSTTPATAARVLIVEDEAVIAINLRCIVQDLGYTALPVASSAPEALQLAEAEGADIALMDIRLRGQVDGIEVADRLWQEYRIPVVFVSAHTDDLTLERARVTSPFGYITKPITVASIKVAIAVALDRHRHEIEVEHRSARFHEALNKVADAIFVCDENDRVLFLNSAAQALAGLTNADARGRSLTAMLEWRAESRVDMELPKPSPLDDSAVRISNLIRANHSDLTVLVTLAELDKSAAPAHHIVTIRNVSAAQEQMMQALLNKTVALERSNSELSLLSHTLIHDLKEPIYTVRIRSDLTADQSASLDQTQQEHLNSIIETCDRMDAFLNKLGLFAGAMLRGDPTIPPVDANSPYCEAIANLQGTIISSQAKIQCSHLPRVLIDPTALVLIFQNLLSNAIKYSAPGIPQIVVSALGQEEFWKIYRFRSRLRLPIPPGGENF